MTNVGSPASAARQEVTGFEGSLIGPGDAGYDEVRKVYNAMIDKRPALIARCAGPDDVAKSVSFARNHELLVALRGGGHNGDGSAARATARAAPTRRPADAALSAAERVR
jgi:hypothetical protein